MTEIYFDILLPLPFDQAFTYKACHGLEVRIGDVVKVPFRKKELWGLVVGKPHGEGAQVASHKIKEIIAKNSLISFSPELLDFVKRVAAYNLAPKGLVLKAFLGVLNGDKVKNQELATRALEQSIDTAKIMLRKLSPNQQKIADEILEGKGASVSLIDAVTGSGKTEIYFAIIAQILKREGLSIERLEAVRKKEDNKFAEFKEKINSDKKDVNTENCKTVKPQILILLPEIALTSQLLSRFEEQFGFKPALWHSKISPKAKREIFYGIVSGSVQVLIGARSALLLPFKNLQLVIVDEEHDSSFKQEDVFNFNARDMAILKAALETFPVILSSATPSLESYQNAKSGKYNYFHLGDKFNQKNSAIEVIDLRQTKLDKGCYISPILRQELAKNIELKQQSLLFLNRRGYAPVTLCKACGEKVNCPNCSCYLVHHKQARTAICHYCGHSEIFSHNCKTCGEKDVIINIGAGVEKIEEEVRSLFPEARIAVITSDNIASFAEVDALVKKITAGEIDIIIGTQIIAKGYDFPGLSLVGVVDADSGFYSSELKSAEKSFQLLSQVIGRAGRKDYHGKIFIQTYNPQNFIFEKIIQNDKKGFFEFEIANRKNMNLPPFTKMASFVISAFEESVALKVAKKLVATIPFNDAIEVLGPAPTAISRLKNRHHFRVFLKVEKKINLQKLILDVMKDVEFPSQVRVKIDIDPS